MLNAVDGNVGRLRSVADSLGSSAGQLPASAPTTQRAAEGAAPGVTALPGSLPAPAAASPPTAIFYRADPFGPVKIDARGTYTVRLGPLERGTLVRAVAMITFNNRLSTLTGTPDIDVIVTGPTGVLTTLARARSGVQISFQANADGDFAIVLDNTYSRVNAKQVSLQFLQP